MTQVSVFQKKSATKKEFAEGSEYTKKKTR